MIVLVFIAVISAMAFMMPKTKLKTYFILSIFVLSMLYAFFTPPVDYDLYRHYGLFNVVRSMSLKELFSTSFEMSNYLMKDYLVSSKAYLVYLFIISQFGVKEILPVLTCFVVYMTAVLRISNLGKEIKASHFAMCVAFIAVLCCLDYRDISSIRNTLAYALFTYVVYEDLVNKRNKIVCFAAYAMLCEMHMACIVLVGLRLVVLISNKYIKGLMVIGLLTVYSLAEGIVKVLSGLFNTPYMNRLFLKIADYRFGRTEYNINGAISFLAIILAMFIIYTCISKAGLIRERYNKYATYSLFVLAFTLGAFSQYDILRRNTGLVVFTFIPFVLIFFNSFTRFRMCRLTICSSHSQVRITSIATAFFFIVLVFALFFFWWIAYRPMDAFFLM